MNLQSITAAFLIIGNEILSGRTKDENLNFLAKELTDLGINLKEVRVVQDIEEDIIFAVNQLRAKYSYVFTSGGIGPTHDDITSESISKAFGDIYQKNERAAEILVKYYGQENINDARLKMAYLPKSASLLDNPVSSAPGFFIENVFVMAGVPKIFQAMFFAAKNQLKIGQKISSTEVQLLMLESVIAKDLQILQDQYLDISIGSYPFKEGTSIVLRGTNKQLIDNATNDLLKIVKKINNEAIIEIK